MQLRRLIGVGLVAGLLAAGCGGGGDGEAAPDLSIERKVGYAVVVDQSGGRTLIGFSTDRNATSGDSYDVTQAVWRVQDGAWNEPPVTCLGRGQRLELGVSKVQNEAQPGLLKDRVIWVGCLSPEAEQ